MGSIGNGLVPSKSLLKPGVIQRINGGKFWTYSFTAATPSGTRVVGFNQTANQVGRHVTNMTAANMIPNPETMHVYAKRIVVLSGTTADFALLCQNMVSNFIYNNRAITEYGCEMYPGGAGPQNNAVAAQAQNGIADPRAVFVFNTPIQIGNNQPFGHEFNGNGFTPAANLVVRVTFDGLYDWGVS